MSNELKEALNALAERMAEESIPLDPQIADALYKDFWLLYEPI